MKVKELIKELKKLDQEAQILASSDEEGNMYGLLTRESIAVDCFDGDYSSKVRKAVVLFPVRQTDDIEDLVN